LAVKSAAKEQVRVAVAQAQVPALVAVAGTVNEFVRAQTWTPAAVGV